MSDKVKMWVHSYEEMTPVPPDDEVIPKQITQSEIGKLFPTTSWEYMSTDMSDGHSVNSESWFYIVGDYLIIITEGWMNGDGSEGSEKEFQYGIHFGLYKIYSNNGVHTFRDKNGGETNKFSQADRFLSGSVKGSGCADMQWEDHECWHICSPDEAVELGELISSVYDIFQAYHNHDCTYGWY